MFVHTGDYVEQNSGTSFPSTYYTFTPRPLMEGGFYDMDERLVSLLTQAYRSIGILEGVSLSLPEKEIFAELLLLKESCFSRMIDYPNFDLRSFIINRGLGKSNDEICNTSTAHIRKSQIFLSKFISNFRQYNPTAPKDISLALNDINKFTMCEDIDPIIKTALCHYQFEIIHPHEQYNGIAGRLLICKMLSAAGFTAIQYASLSESLYDHKMEYFDKLGITQCYGSYRDWIEFFIRITEEAVQNAIKTVIGYNEFITADLEKIVTKTGNTAEVYNHFRKNIVSSVGTASEQLQLSFNAASRAIDILVNLGILEQITKQSRNRLFAHTRLMKLIFPNQ